MPLEVAPIAAEAAYMHPRTDPDGKLPLLVSASQALALGMTRNQIRQRVRAGEWKRVRSGFYWTRSDWRMSNLDDFALARLTHGARATAAHRKHRGTVVAYESAAAQMALPTWKSLDTDVNLVVPPGVTTGIRAGVRVRRLNLPEEHIDRDRIPRTTSARTWLDITCRGSLADSLVVGDAILARDLATHTELVTMVDYAEGSRLPGRCRARLAVAHLDAVRESPLESASYAYFVDHRLPLPESQVEIRDEHGNFVARVDFLWTNPVTGVKVVGEADGLGKYDGEGALLAEKRREDALRELGYVVVRWGARDLRGPGLAHRLRRCCG